MKPERIVKKFTLGILQKKNVVTVGLGTKYVGGVDTGKVAFVVGVKQKLPLSKLAAEDVVPTEIKGLITDVIEAGEIKLLNQEPDRKKKWRPAPGGVSIGHYQITAGTLGCLVYKDRRPMILSNNHVLANVNKAQIADPILQPGAYDGGTPLDSEIAKLWEFIEIKILGPSDCSIAKAVANIINFWAWLFSRRTRLMPVSGFGTNLVDCAIAKPNQDGDIKSAILEVGSIIGEAEAVVGMKVKKSGRSSGLTYGEIKQVNVTANVQVGEGKIAMFTDQFAMGAISEPGDSGSIILTEDNRCIGLLFAGSETITLANRYSNVKAELRLD